METPIVLRLVDNSVAVIYSDRTVVVAPDGSVDERAAASEQDEAKAKPSTPDRPSK